MVLTGPGYVDQEAIDAAVRRVEEAWSSQVVHIRRSFGEDHAGFPAVFFRVLLRDEAAVSGRLGDLVPRLPFALMDEARTHENGLHAYVNFRSVSEQEQLKDPDWD